jgi:hypothetical protein
MQKRTKNFGSRGRRLAALFSVLGIAACMAIPASAGAGASLSAPGMSLAFASGKARNVADNVAVPVQCVGGGRGFCSGVVTLSRKGHRIAIPFSVRGGSREVLFVPLRLGPGTSRSRKVYGVATTVQPLGPPTSTKEFLYTE